MPINRRVPAEFVGVLPLRGEGGSGVVLSFEPRRSRIEVDRIDDFAFLGPALDIPVVDGLGKVLRILRAARIALPCEAAELMNDEQRTAGLLRRAVGTLLVLELKPRSRLRFKAWTESGVEVVDDVTEVVESPDAFLVLRQKGRFPVRVARETVVRQQTECERWYEVLDIERAPEG